MPGIQITIPTCAPEKTPFKRQNSLRGASHAPGSKNDHHFLGGVLKTHLFRQVFDSCDIH